MSGAIRDKLRAEVQAVDAASLVPHHHRGALFILARAVDLLDVAVAVATDDTAVVTALVESGQMGRPSASQLADWCVDVHLRFQFVILQPYVLAQPLPRDSVPGA